MKKSISILIAAGLLALPAVSLGAKGIKYARPSHDVEEMILAKPLPEISFNPRMTQGIVYQENEKYHPISEIASIREFKVAGLRLDGDNFSQTRKKVYGHLELIDAASGALRQISGLPQGLAAYDLKWSQDGCCFCFLNDTPREVELYRVDVTAVAPAAVKINQRPVNSIFGGAYVILDDGRILYKSVPADKGAFPEESAIPEGPIVISSKNRKDSYKTYQDLIKSPYDEAVFDYLCTADLSLYDGNTTRTVVGGKVISAFSVSPDGSHVIVTTLHKPYSYSKKYTSFRKRISVLDMEGREVSVLKKLKAAKGAPSRSNWEWRNDKPATLVWKEKPSGKGRGYKSCLLGCTSPFSITDNPDTLFLSDADITEVIWATDRTAMAIEKSSKRKVREIKAFNPSDRNAAPVTLLSEDTREFSAGARMLDGRICRQRGSGRAVIDEKGGYVFLFGNKRFAENGLAYSYIDRISLKDGSRRELFSSGTEYRTTLACMGSVSKKGDIQFIATEETPTQVPNYVSFSVNRKGKVAKKPISSFKNTLPHSDEIRMEYLRYKRADGLECAARVYLPASYDKARDGKLPVFMWTYPREHYTAQSVKVNRRAPHNMFAMPDQWNQIFWCLKGYAVVLDWTMAILAPDRDGDYNEDFIGQLKMNAEAIVNALDEAGIGDRDRMAVGGLSYGSFMTANLLAHTNLYKCGFANSGAFNRTLTPYGFQHYTKKYWKEEQIYHDMSPFNYADKIKAPILITHGQMDENTGTHPIQSERLYYAIAGNGGNATYLQLPYEGHKMAYRENVLHYFSVVEKMLDKYLKNK